MHSNVRRWGKASLPLAVFLSIYGVQTAAAGGFGIAGLDSFLTTFATGVTGLGVVIGGVGLAGYVRSGRWPLAAASAAALATLVFRLTSDSLGAPVALLLTGLILLGTAALLLVRRRSADRQ